METPKSFGQRILYWIAIAGAIASITMFIYGIGTRTDWRSLYIAISGLIYSMALISILVYLMNERKKLVQEKYEALMQAERVIGFRHACHRLHSISHRFRDTFQKIEVSTSPLAYDDIRDSGFPLCVLDNLKNIFDQITGVTCSTCIKLLILGTNRVVTFTRDTASAAEAELLDYNREATVESNTASERIVNNGDAYFFSNNLLELHKSGNYKSDRPNWERRYLSTIVLPVRCFDEKKKKHKIPAMLCIDSKKINCFDEDICVQVGACVTDMLFPYFNHRNIKWTPRVDDVKKPLANIKETVGEQTEKADGYKIQK